MKISNDDTVVKKNKWDMYVSILFEGQWFINVKFRCFLQGIGLWTSTLCAYVILVCMSNFTSQIHIFCQNEVIIILSEPATINQNVKFNWMITKRSSLRDVQLGT